MRSYFISFSLILLSSYLFAQKDTSTMDEVIVSASKYALKASQTGKVVSVITRDEIDKSGSRDLSQLISGQSGFFINGANSNPGKDKSIYLRGAKVDYTLITIDGVPLYDPSGIGSNFDIRLMSIDQIERIEILKGSQSTLYGTDAMAGVINIITRKNSSKASSIQGSYSYGSYQTNKGSLGISGTLKKWDYQVNYAFVKSGGINEAADTINPVTDRDAYAQHNLYESFTYKPNDHLKIRPYLRFAKFNQQYDQGAFTDELDLSSTNTNLQAGIISEIKWKQKAIRLLYNFHDNNRIYTDDSLLSRNGYDIYSNGIYKGKEHFAEALIHFPLKENIKFTGGIDFRSSQSDQSYFSLGYFGPYESKLGKDSLKQQQTGIYGSFNISYKNRFYTELGGRWNYHSAYGSNAAFNFNPSFLWKERRKFFINVSTAFKTPTLYQLYSEYGNRNLKPEKALTLEGGLQLQSNNKKLEARITAFNRMVTDAIAFFYDPNTFASFYINQDKQNDHGVEIESKFKLNNKTSIHFNYSYVDGQITTKVNGKDTTYFNLFRRPKSTMSLTVFHEINKRWRMNLGIGYVGQRTDLSYDVFYNPIQINLKPYALLNFYAEYIMGANGNKFFLDVCNITNAKYYEAYGFNTLRRNIAVGLKCSL